MYKVIDINELDVNSINDLLEKSYQEGIIEGKKIALLTELNNRIMAQVHNYPASMPLTQVNYSNSACTYEF